MHDYIYDSLAYGGASQLLDTHSTMHLKWPFEISGYAPAKNKMMKLSGF